MLDDGNVLKQRDPRGALVVAAAEWVQAEAPIEVRESAHDGRELTRIVHVGIGSSAVAGLLAKSWLGWRLGMPFEVVRGGDLPGYVDASTLVIISDYPGDTVETLDCLRQARERSAQVAVVASGGKLLASAERHAVAHVVAPGDVLTRMATIAQLRGLVALLVNFGIVSTEVESEITRTAQWLQGETAQWLPSVTTAKNEAKQLALLAAGKTPVFYGGALTGSLAYKWKLSWNETAKNVAFCGEYPDCSYGELAGWVSHPVEKPFAVFDLVSEFEHPRVLAQVVASDRLLSGKRPKAHRVDLRGDTVIAQLLWGVVLADFVSIYVAVINTVDPTADSLTKKLQAEVV